MDTWKSTAKKKPRHGESQKGEDKRGRIRRETVRRETMQPREKVGSRETLCFSNDLLLRKVLGRSKSGLAKGAGAEL